MNFIKHVTLLPLRWIRRWIEPRATDRDIAFRERNIRTGVALVGITAVINSILSFIIFQDNLSLISMPSLNYSVMIGLLIPSWLVNRNRIHSAAWSLLIVVFFAASGLALVVRQSGTLTRLFIITPVFLFPSLISALVLPRRVVVITSILSIFIFTIIMFFIPLNASVDSQLNPPELVGQMLNLILIQGVLLWRLLVEFDSRFRFMAISVDQAKEAQQRAEEADKTKSQFLANMSHELRTPLNAIIGYDEAMLAGMAGEFTPQQTKLLGHIQHNSRRLLNLINDILDLSKIESGSMEVYVSPMSPKVTIVNTVESLQSLASQKDIVLEVSFSDNFPEIIMGDAKKIEQILVNLLSNAIKFTEQGNITVKAQSTNQSYWQFSVIDTGIGIAADVIGTIFDPFTQVDGTTTRKYKGTGLGLSITKQLVEMMGGTIEVSSTLEVGTTFLVTLPRFKLPQTGQLNVVTLKRKEKVNNDETVQEV